MLILQDMKITYQCNKKDPCLNYANSKKIDDLDTILQYIQRYVRRREKRYKYIWSTIESIIDLLLYFICMDTRIDTLTLWWLLTLYSDFVSKSITFIRNDQIILKNHILLPKIGLGFDIIYIYRIISVFKKMN